MPFSEKRESPFSAKGGEKRATRGIEGEGERKRGDRGGQAQSECGEKHAIPIIRNNKKGTSSGRRPSPTKEEKGDRAERGGKGSACSTVGN